MRIINILFVSFVLVGALSFTAKAEVAEDFNEKRTCSCGYSHKVCPVHGSICRYFEAHRHDDGTSTNDELPLVCKVDNTYFFGKVSSCEDARKYIIEETRQLVNELQTND